MQLSIVTLGHVHTEDLAALTQHFDRLEQLVLDIHPRSSLADHRAELNRAVDAASNDWILIVREPETIDETLAGEIATSVDAAKAWGFRIRTTPLYCGKPLQVALGGGELRLFHRRHFLRRGEPGVQGTVVRLGATFRAVTFASPDEHRAYLGRTAVPHSSLRHLLLFLAHARTIDRNTLRYLWIEAGWDHEAASAESEERRAKSEERRAKSE